ncbi:MAG: leucine-rich repeat-containing protein kinase family protein [Leptolyngbyaceae cyanobacterium bins.302]|nr:leucine-rich repeat-containing protein kinase family protein [Leptolyngbyaceae cyanobacterium bins.302]
METLNRLQSGQLKGTKRLDLAAGLTQFPPEIFELADSLEILNLSNNQFKSLPDEFASLQQLKIVFLSNNEFEELPTVLSQCPKLSMIGFKANRITTIAEAALPPSIRWLILTDNQIERLPASMGHLKQLQKLMLAGNQLRSLPATMVACQNLELIRLSANQLDALPDWLLTLPRLSWLAYSGNPFCDQVAGEPRSLACIDWANLTFKETLGEGASGIISKAIWRNPQTQQELDVAVKVFKGHVTSDGLPMDEMQTCIAAGSHPNLVKLLGKLINHPEQKSGLIFDCIPLAYKNLGNPPSLESCTRDTYPPNTTFSFPVTLRISQNIAAVAAHLHANKLLHGDLYAHNILIDDTGESLLSDFGAASFYPGDNPSLHRSLESLEVRAFGCLLEDLLEHLDPSSADAKWDSNSCDRLHQLQQDCMNPLSSARPLFAEIWETLGKLYS